ncbi:MAG: hypothetical protein AAGJ38_00980 [Planctomycetota bacterium]
MTLTAEQTEQIRMWSVGAAYDTEGRCLRLKFIGGPLGGLMLPVSVDAWSWSISTMGIVSDGITLARYQREPDGMVFTEIEDPVIASRAKRYR